MSAGRSPVRRTKVHGRGVVPNLVADPVIWDGSSAPCRVCLQSPKEKCGSMPRAVSVPSKPWSSSSCPWHGVGSAGNERATSAYVGLPVYNGEKYIAESLEALLGQGFTDFELIISDNASTDSTGEICRRYEDPDSRVRYFRQSRNIGLSPNHNFVAERARGELFKWASNDDLYARDLLERCIDALDQYPDIVLARCWTAKVDESGTVSQALRYLPNTASPRAPSDAGACFSITAATTITALSGPRSSAGRRSREATITRTAPSWRNWPCTAGSIRFLTGCTSGADMPVRLSVRTRPCEGGA